MNRLAIILTIVLIAAGCAKRPDAIVPTSISSDIYTALDCKQIGDELARETQTLTTLSRAQNDAATGDAFSVFVIGVPLASAAGGNKEGLIAVSKGKVQALEGAKLRKSC
ncbi:hypothetical protein IMCC20628_02251 [Hoeflea sp. IMCC20628]|uniref:hypothetical protein n=1 Tax=Hoeflea sp. IMCC20628 TaxID=1620421 RepID=UPI00063AB9D6|nr:hypothetical protein [Hoeflea sp. IMCC20628]AKI00950.1 hypothetical protein IMCC20628_02251 [Hoeflea sp. IMCC20628]